MKDYGNYTDQQLVTLLKDKDDHAFTEIYERYWSVLYIHARRLLQDDDLAQDAVHDVFATLWKKSAELELTNTLNSYLYRTVKNAILNDIRHERVAANYLAELKRFYQEGATSTDELVHLKELQVLIEQEIQNLPEEMRKVFEMSRKRHLSNAEIAIELNKSELTVKNQIKRAKDILRDRLDLPSLLILFILKP
jgi:RNA polymerase sigma-70 factor (family 1)